MIDIENKVYNDVVATVRNAFATNYPNLSCYGEYVEAPSGFPCISLVEENNTRYTKSNDSTQEENHANITYVCNIFTNTDNKKELAKSIAKTIDGAMSELNFNRVLMNQIPNLDRTIYRIVIRYNAVVDKGFTKNGNTVHTIYRK